MLSTDRDNRSVQSVRLHGTSEPRQLDSFFPPPSSPSRSTKTYWLSHVLWEPITGHIIPFITTYISVLGINLYRPHQISEIPLKVSWRVEALSHAARQIPTLTDRLTGSPKTGRSGPTACPGYPQKAAMMKHWIVPIWHFSTSLTEGFFRAFPQL